MRRFDSLGTLPRRGILVKLIAVHPGDILLTEFLEPLGITAHRLSRELHVSAPTVNDLVRQRRSISAEMALLLGRYFGTGPELWMNLQAEYDRRRALGRIKAKLAAIRPLSRTQAKSNEKP